MLFNINISKKIKAFTYIEILISMSVISFLFLILIQTILTIYRANQYISTVNKSLSETHYFTQLIKRLLISSKPETIICNAPDNDYNNDGQLDKDLITFTTLFNEKTYKLVLLQELTLPFKNNSYYNALALLEYDELSNNYQLLSMISNPSLHIKNVQVECSNMIEDKRQNAYVRSVSIQGISDSTATYLFIPELLNTPIVQNLSFFENILVIN